MCIMKNTMKICLTEDFCKAKTKPSEWSFPEQINKGDEIPEKLHDHDLRLAHIHVIPVGSEHWLRHIAFRDYLRTHPAVLTEYQKLKEELGKKSGRMEMNIMTLKMILYKMKNKKQFAGIKTIRAEIKP